MDTFGDMVESGSGEFLAPPSPPWLVCPTGSQTVCPASTKYAFYCCDSLDDCNGLCHPADAWFTWWSFWMFMAFCLFVITPPAGYYYTRRQTVPNATPPRDVELAQHVAPQAEMKVAAGVPVGRV